MSEFEEKVISKLDELLLWKAALDERCKAHREKTDDVRKTLYGNPNGVVKKVNTLWNCKKNLQETQKLWKTTLIYILSRLTVVGIIVLIGWLLLVYKVIEIGG